MMPDRYKQFIFESYEFDAGARTLNLYYSLDGHVNFTETYHFDFAFVDYDPSALDRACQLLFFMAGVSYYKAYVPRQIAVRRGHIDRALADFLGKTYQRGLGEFWFVNRLDPHTPVTFPVTDERIETPHNTAPGRGLLVGIGGGKDSLVSVELLHQTQHDMATWSSDHRPQLTPLVGRINLPHFWVERTWDRKLLALAGDGALNGHIPISAIFACLGVVTAILAGRRDVVVSNEQSANEPDFAYEGVEINHQYSKSQEFEDDFQNILRHGFGDSLRYYSFLRPLSELHIAKLFAERALQKYKDVFSSCNRAFVHTSHSMSWCGACPKCAFTFLMLTPFVPRQTLEDLWGGKNLLLDPALEPVYRQLLGIEGGKPLDCVGEVKESRSAMRMAQQQYPELNDKYSFELPDDYDWQKLASHHMPPELYTQLIQSIDKHKN